jgi:glutaredoxin
MSSTLKVSTKTKNKQPEFEPLITEAQSTLAKEHPMTNYKLDLYYYDSCPFCQLVLDFIRSENLKLNYCDITASNEHLSKLVADTGRRTVPCLYINDKPMFESRDIINWLGQNKDQIEKEN